MSNISERNLTTKDNRASSIMAMKIVSKDPLPFVYNFLASSLHIRWPVFQNDSPKTHFGAFLDGEFACYRNTSCQGFMLAFILGRGHTLVSSSLPWILC